MDISSQIGLDNRARVIYSTPPDRYVNSSGYTLPIWVRLVTGAQLWVLQNKDNEATACLMQTGDVL